MKLTSTGPGVWFSGSRRFIWKMLVISDLCTTAPMSVDIWIKLMISSSSLSPFSPSITKFFLRLFVVGPLLAAMLFT